MSFQVIFKACLISLINIAYLGFLFYTFKEPNNLVFKNDPKSSTVKEILSRIQQNERGVDSHQTALIFMLFLGRFFAGTKMPRILVVIIIVVYIVAWIIFAKIFNQNSITLEMDRIYRSEESLIYECLDELSKSQKRNYMSDSFYICGFLLIFIQGFIARI